MSLPPPSSGVYWKSYEISTPTFQLTPIEKPDMSPFLVHMTGKDEITNILTGKNAPKALEREGGFLRASVPESSEHAYTAKVVCFTESPTFALDFFRYRSFRRWKRDQRFGIGFDKTKLFHHGVRPVVYTENELNKQIVYLYNYIQKNQVSKDEDLNSRLINLVKSIYPLLFPLLEDEDQQGYMWEREWRATDENGFIFGYEDIRVICCPQEEEGSIRDILGNAASNIQFIRAWREYDDVTRFLERQQRTWQENGKSLSQAEKNDQRIGIIKKSIQEYQVTKHGLTSYQEFIECFDRDQEQIEREIAEIDQRIDSLKAQLLELEEKENMKSSP